MAALSVADGAFAAAPIRLAARVTVNGEGEPGATHDHRRRRARVPADDRRRRRALQRAAGGAAGRARRRRLRRQAGQSAAARDRSGAAAVSAPAARRGAADAAGRRRGARRDRRLRRRRARQSRAARAAARLRASAGTLSPPTSRGDGSTTWTLTAPTSLGTGAVTLRAGGATTTVALRPGPPRAIEVLTPKEPLPAGLDAAVTVEVRVRDAERLAGAGATLTAALAGGRVLGTSERARAARLYAIELVPPRDAGRGTALLHVEVAGVAPGPPRRVTLHPLPRAADGSLAAEAWVDDDLGLPVAGARVELAAPGHERHRRRRSLRHGAPGVRARRARAASASPRSRPSCPGVAAALDYLVVGSVVHAVGASPAAASSRAASRRASRRWTRRCRCVRRRRSTCASRSSRRGRGRASRCACAWPCAAAPRRSCCTRPRPARIELVRQPDDGVAELRFVPPADAPPGQPLPRLGHRRQDARHRVHRGADAMIARARHRRVVGAVLGVAAPALAVVTVTKTSNGGAYTGGTLTFQVSGQAHRLRDRRSWCTTRRRRATRCCASPPAPPRSTARPCRRARSAPTTRSSPATSAASCRRRSATRPRTRPRSS